jgi:hypothetical protein
LNGVGVNTGAATTASIADSIVSENTTGIQAGNSTSVISAKDNQVTLNGTGFSTLAGATIRLGGNLVSGNGTGLSGSNLFSFGQTLLTATRSMALSVELPACNKLIDRRSTKRWPVIK